MKPEHLQTKIFLDSGDPAHTQEIVDLLGFLDGQTTNPSLVAKNPEAQARVAAGNPFGKDEIYDFYKGVVQKISSLVPGKSISIEVYADAQTSAEDMIRQGKEYNEWIDSAHIKLPVTQNGLLAARALVDAGINVNMTLVFSQEQAAAVYAATKGAQQGQVYISPFDGRLDDIDVCGMCVIEHIQKMYNEKGDGHVEILMASIRDMDHVIHGIGIGVDIMTVPYPILKQWGENSMPMPDKNDVHIDKEKGLRSPEYREFDLEESWETFDIKHELTDKGLQRFADDWNALLGN